MSAPVSEEKPGDMAEVIEDLSDKIQHGHIRVMELDPWHTSGYQMPLGDPGATLDVSALELLARASEDGISQEGIRPILNAHLKDGAT